MTKKNTVAEIIAQKFIDELEKGSIPWVRPWELWKSWSGSTGKDYEGVNVILLDGGEYLTAKQIKENGGSIVKGSKAHKIVHYNHTKKVVSEEKANELMARGYRVYLDKDTGNYINEYSSMSYFNVFNVVTETTLEIKHNKKVRIYEHVNNVEADALINSYVVSGEFTISEGSNQAYTDGAKIVIPNSKQFKTSEWYYSTVFHEMIHTTAKRFKRDLSKYSKDDRVRAREELVAEIGASYIMSYLGMDTNKSFENSAAYIQSWARYLKDDVNAILYATPKAIEAGNYIIGLFENYKAS